MPNYRIPNNANDDANGMWKMNAVQRATKGDEWPDPYAPPVQYYIKRQNNLTDGNTATPGTAWNLGGTWGYSNGWTNCDAVGFSHQQTGSLAGYKLNKISLGVGNGWWDGGSGAILIMIKIYTGLGSSSGNVIYYSGGINIPQGTDVWGTNMATTSYGTSQYSYMFLDIPLIGNTPSDILPTLSWNTAYTVAFSYGSGNGQGYASTTSTNSSSTITLADGNTITQNNFDVSSSLSDSAPFGSSNGTTLSGGQFPVLGFLF